MSLRQLSLLALLAASIVISAQERPVNLLKQEIAEKLEEIYKEWDREDGPGGVVAISLEGNMVFAKAYGLAEIEDAVPNTVNTKFEVGSVSKQFTAMCILLLEEDGLLSLDDPVEKFIKGMPILENGITIRHLLTHTSGIRDHLALMAVAGKREFGDEDIEAMLRKQQDLNFEPGTQFMYSNSGYFLLAAIVQAVTGKPLSQVAKERIFDPLEMNDTVIADGSQETILDRATSYRGFRSRFFKATDSRTASGAIGVTTTVYDMMKWQENFESNVLGRGSLDLPDQMLEPYVLNDGTATTYGLGLYVNDLGGVRRVLHTGSWLGFQSIVSRFPDHNLTVMTFGNDGSEDAILFNGQLSQLILESEMDAPTQDPRRNMDLTDGLLQEYVGLYKVGDGNVATITREGRRLRIRLTGEPRRDLFAEQADSFYTRESSVEVAFRYDGEGVVRSGTISQDGKRSAIQRIEPYEPDADYLAQLAGTYHSSELGIDLVVVEANGELYIARQGRRRQRFNFHLPDWAMLRGTKVQFVRDKHGQVTELLQSMDRIENLWFVREKT